MKQFTILVVDDTASILKLTKDIFELEGFKVVTAVDGEEALIILSKDKIDLVITDILMPNTDGYILCYTIRTTEKLKEIPVIIYSATYTSSSDEQMAMEIGADLFIRKPASMDELSAAARHLLSDSRKFVHKIPQKPKSLEASRLYNEGLVNKLERRNIELEEAKLKLEHNESLLKEAHAMAHMGNWEINLITNIQTWSDELYAIYGIERNEIEPVVESFFSFFHPEDLPAATKALENTFANHSSGSYNYRFIRKDGALRYGYSEWKFEFNAAGNPSRLYGIVQDITEKKEAEEKLALSEQRFRSLIENSSEGISLTDKASNVIYRSPAVYKITGSAPGERTTNTLGYTHPDDYETMRRTFENAAKKPEVPTPFQARFLHPKGHYYWLEGTLTNLLGVKGVNAIVANFRDITKRKIAEQSLVESNERFELVSRATSDAIWDWDIKQNTTLWNHGLKTLFGYEEQKITDSRQWWKEKIHPDDYDRVWEEINRVFAKMGPLWNSLYRYKTVGGKYRHVFDRAQIVYSDDGPIRMIGAMQDVDDRIKTLEELNRLSIVASKTDNSVMIMDKEARIEWVNESFTRLSGFALPEVKGRRPFEFLHGPETDKLQLKEILEKVREGKAFTAEILNYAKTGSKYWVRNTVTPIFGEKGELDKIVTIQSDVTEQKEFEKNITAIARELTNLIDNANVPIFGFDRNGYINEWNTIASELLEYSKNEVYEKKLIEFLDPTNHEAVKMVIQKVLKGESIGNYELPFRSKSGKKLIIMIGFSPRYDNDKNIKGAICVGQDITEVIVYRQGLEKMVDERTRELNEALKKEKELVGMKSKFVSIASHEFRTPLSTISFAAESIRNYFGKLTAEEIQKKLIKIEDQARHMTHLLEDILTLGKSEAGKIKVNKISLDLKEFIDSLIEEVLATFKEKRKISFKYASSQKNINTDDKLLRNVVNNLLTNALKFSSPDKTVVIAVSDYSGGVLIEVTDKGIGIPENELTSVFESFQRGSNVAEIQGTGLGLSILKKAIELMDGSVSVKSLIDKGSTFTVKLPSK